MTLKKVYQVAKAHEDSAVKANAAKGTRLEETTQGKQAGGDRKAGGDRHTDKLEKTAASRKAKNKGKPRLRQSDALSWRRYLSWHLLCSLLNKRRPGWGLKPDQDGHHQPPKHMAPSAAPYMWHARHQ